MRRSCSSSGEATPGQPYTGVGPLSWAHTTAQGCSPRLNAPLPMKQAGPIANLLAIPQDGGDDDDDTDPLMMLKADIAAARGKALFARNNGCRFWRGNGERTAQGLGSEADWGLLPPEAYGYASLRRLSSRSSGNWYSTCIIHRFGRHKPT